MGGSIEKEPFIKSDSLFYSEVFSYPSPLGKGSREAGTDGKTPLAPLHGNSFEEMGGARPTKSLGPGRPGAIVLMGIEQLITSGPIRSDALLTGHGEQTVTGSTKPADPRITPPYQGTLRKEGTGLWQTVNKEMSRLDKETASFWEKTLPTEDWTREPRRDDPVPGVASKSKVEEESVMVKDFEWARSQENIDLGPSETGTQGKTSHSQRDRKCFSWIDDISREKDQTDPALARARRRNTLRLKKANEADLSIISKYLPSDASVFFPIEIEGPDDFYEVKAGWLEKVLAVARSDCPLPKAPLVRFGTTPEDLNHNTDYLADCGWDFDEVFSRHRGTTVDHGSEFRPVEDLQTFLGQHPYFPDLSDMFRNGFSYKLSRELSEEERAAELAAQLVRGNHKSATNSEEEVRLLLEGDVRHGFVLPVWEDALYQVKGGMLQPGGMVRQLSLKADGTRKIKNRFTHDLSFSITAEDASVNARIDMGRYTDMVYGWCFQRILHYLAALRSTHPNKKIYMSKFDNSDAYKRISQCPHATAMTAVRFGRIAYFCWRMVFGGSPNPAGFSCFSETLTDLANEIAMSGYQPHMGRSDTVQPSHLVTKEVEERGAPIETAIKPALVVSTKLTSYRDCFIDDIIDCHLDTPTNIERAPHIVQLAVQAMSRPHAGGQREPVPRRPLLGPDKLEAEGRSSERQIVLGWEIRTRAFSVTLPFDKHKAWTEDLDKIIEAGEATQQETESMIGRLNHASYLIPLSRHFLNEIRTKCLSVPRKKGQHVRFTEEEVKDLILWRSLLQTAKEGISINLLVVRTPTRIAWSDSCPYGLGGYTLKGTAWRIRIPAECAFYGDDSVNNVLEFLGMAISVLLLLQEAKEADERFPCLLVLGDNTSAIAWLFKSGKVPRSSNYYPIVKAIARHVALAVTKGGAQLCSQHIAGAMNVISDLLSFEGRSRQYTNPLTEDCPPNDVLTCRILNCHSQIVPSGFRIRGLPTEIESFTFSILQIIARSWRPKEKRPTREETDIGDAGQRSSGTGGWEMTLSSIQYPETTSGQYWLEDSSCRVACSTSTDRVRLLQNVRSQWYQRLFEMPLAAWHRRLGTVDGRAPSTSRSESMVRDRSIPGSGPC